MAVAHHSTDTFYFSPKDSVAAPDEVRHLNFLGLHRNPFPLTPSGADLYVSDRIDQIITEIVHGIVTRKGFMILTGEVGLGKTTIVRKIMDILTQREVATSLVFNTVLQETALLKEINHDFGLSCEDPSLECQLKTLNDFLVKQNDKGKNSAVIIDDAQNLTRESLEMIRVISNLETDREKLIQIVLVGQPELIATLNSHNLRQLKSRIVIHKEVTPLDLADLNEYLGSRLQTAGTEGYVTIEKNAIKPSYRYSQGNIRKLNILMERCLYAAFLHDTYTITGNLVREAAIDLKFAPEKPSQRRIYKGIALCALLLLAGWAASPVFTGRSIQHTANIYPVSSPQEISPSQSNLGTAVEISEPKPEIKPENPLENNDAGFETAILDTQPSISETLTRTEDIPESILTFLSAYGLEDFGESFYFALSSDRLDEEAQAIRAHTGYQMIELKHIPETIRIQYDMLSFHVPPDDDEAFLLFWQPEFEIKKFYLKYKGPEITRLQELLAGHNLYFRHANGKVEKRSMEAIIQFQKQNKLPITGFPDKETVFLLCRLTDK